MSVNVGVAMFVIFHNAPCDTPDGASSVAEPTHAHPRNPIRSRGHVGNPPVGPRRSKRDRRCGHVAGSVHTSAVFCDGAVGAPYPTATPPLIPAVALRFEYPVSFNR